MQLPLNKFLKPIKINSLNVSFLIHPFASEIISISNFLVSGQLLQLNPTLKPFFSKWNSRYKRRKSERGKGRICTSWESFFCMIDRVARITFLSTESHRSQTRFIGFNLRFLPFASVNSAKYTEYRGAELKRLWLCLQNGLISGRICNKPSSTFQPCSWENKRPR